MRARPVPEVPAMKSFRTVVCLALVFHVVGMFVLPHMPFLFSNDVAELAQYSGHGAKFNVRHPVVYAVYLMVFPGLVGMLFLQNWGRHLVVGYTSVILFLTFFSGASISGPPETFVSTMAILLDGAGLGLAYLALPVREAFKTKKFEARA